MTSWQAAWAMFGLAVGTAFMSIPFFILNDENPGVKKWVRNLLIIELVFISPVILKLFIAVLSE